MISNIEAEQKRMQMKNSYFIHYANNVYKIIDYPKNTLTGNTAIIYQAQYNIPELGADALFWKESAELFFENKKGTDIPRFKFIGYSHEEVKKYLKNNTIRTKDKILFDREHMLMNSTDPNLVVNERYAIQGFAVDSDNENLSDPNRTIILFCNGNVSLESLPLMNFYEKSNVIAGSKEDSNIRQYIDKLYLKKRL